MVHIDRSNEVAEFNAMVDKLDPDVRVALAEVLESLQSGNNNQAMPSVAEVHEMVQAVVGRNEARASGRIN